MKPLRTGEQARQWLDEQGISITAFALAHGLDPATTYQVLAGRKKGKRGHAHDAAVELGMKQGVRLTEDAY